MLSLYPLAIYGLVYASLILSAGYGVSYLAQHGHLNSGFKRFLAILAVGCVSAFANVGPLGLILGGPSIVVSSLIVAVAFRPKEKV